jgi:hypothetical protein
MGMRVGRWFAVVAVLAAAGAIVPGLALAGKGGKKPKPRPDLVVSGHAVKPPLGGGGQNYIVIPPSGDAKVFAGATVSNEAKAMDPDDFVRVSFWLRRGGARVAFGSGRDVPLGAGKTSKLIEAEMGPVALQPGMYELEACVDPRKQVKEAGKGAEANNCTKTPVPAVPEYWDVRAFFSHCDGCAGQGPRMETNTTSGFYFQFANVKTAEDGGLLLFEHQAHGSIFQRVYGSFSGSCDLSGEGMLTHSPWAQGELQGESRLAITADLKQFEAGIGPPTGSQHPATLSCPGVQPQPFPQAFQPIETRAFQQKAADARTLVGSGTLSQGQLSIAFGYDFQARLP